MANVRAANDKMMKMTYQASERLGLVLLWVFQEISRGRGFGDCLIGVLEIGIIFGGGGEIRTRGRR